MDQTSDHMRSWAEAVSPLSDRELRPAVRLAKRWDEEAKKRLFVTFLAFTRLRATELSSDISR
jgi:hypothetical protein